MLVGCWGHHAWLSVFLQTIRCGRIGPCDGKGTGSHSILSRLVAASVRRGLGTTAATGRECWPDCSAWCGTALRWDHFGNLKAAWHVLRGSQAWAPYPDNDPEAARRHMARFFRMANRAGRLRFDPRLAAELEVAWWQAHRAQQHDAQVTYDDLVTAMVRFYCYVYQADPADVRRAAELRVQAMALSDAWVAAGCHLDDPTLAEERLGARWPLMPRSATPATAELSRLSSRRLSRRSAASLFPTGRSSRQCVS